MQKKLFTLILFIILSCLLVACDSNKSMESNSKAKEFSDKDKSRDNIALEKKKVDFAKVYEITFGEYSLTTPEYTVTVDADTKEVILMDAAKSEKNS